jgi:hypothetical protein
VSGNNAFVDTSAILRLLVKDDPAKAKAVEKLLRESKDKGTTLLRTSGHDSGNSLGHRESVSPQQKDDQRACRSHLEHARTEVPPGACLQTSRRYV